MIFQFLDKHIEDHTAFFGKKPETLYLGASDFEEVLRQEAPAARGRAPSTVKGLHLYFRDTLILPDFNKASRACPFMSSTSMDSIIEDSTHAQLVELAKSSDVLALLGSFDKTQLAVLLIDPDKQVREIANLLLLKKKSVGKEL